MKITKRQLRQIIKERAGAGHYAPEPAHRRSGLGKNVADVDFPILVRYSGRSEVVYDQDTLDDLLDYLTRENNIAYSLDSLDDVEALDAPIGAGIELYGEHASLTEKKEQIDEDDELSPDDYLDTAAAIFENRKIRITRRQLRRIIAEEKQRLAEVNPDGTISADEDEREEELEGEILRELDNLIQAVRAEADEIGGGFRAPGIRARIYRQMAEMIHGAR